MLQEGDRVVAGISGGADSVCLLFLLLEWAKIVPTQIAVVHVNHGIRREAAQDAAYVERLCKEQGLPFYLIEEDVRKKACREQLSEEEAGRNVRYEAFHRIAQEWGATKIAVAHNSNDRSETMLFHLFRGSGMKGLAGIQPKREEIIRPILCLERREIEEYLAECGIDYCHDATNDKDDYTRNRIRHHILPFAEEQIAEGSIAHMAQTADLLAEVEDYLEGQTEAAYEECLVEEHPQGMTLKVDKLKALHPAIGKRVLYKALHKLSCGGRDIGSVHVKGLQELLSKNENPGLDLVWGIRARKEYDHLILEQSLAQESAQLLLPKEVSLEQLEQGKVCLDWGKDEWLELQIILPEIGQKVPQNQYTKWFDYDKIDKSLCVRTRQVGDYLSIAGQNGELRHKMVQDYLVNEKVPKAMREQIPVLAQEQHIIWLVGYRISEYYKVNKNTKRILQVQLIGKSTDKRTEEENGRTC